MAAKGTAKDSDNVKVSVRCRPINETELKQGHNVVVKADEMHGTITINKPHAKYENEVKTFTFDTVFGPDSKQFDIYNATARPIVDSVIEGYNGTVFAYGQTGTGKTYTMEGNRSVPELVGIIPNSFAHLFGHISKCEEDTTFLVRCSYLEIYNEEVRDLLDRDHTTKKEVKERPDVGVYVKDLKSFVVTNTEEMDRLMTIGNKNRVVGRTNMNEHSSRSHAIYTITLECSSLGPDKQQHLRMGKLHLVDLAGSERQSKTGATGERLVEATKINLSLSTLGNVISALVDGKRTHVPYRNSKLTRLLQDSLGGNSKTVMIANIGPAGYNYDETLSTLWYANRAKNIKNKARINEDPKDAMLREYQKEIELLRKRLAQEAEDDGDEWESEEEIGVDDEGKERKHRSVKRKKSMTPKKMMALQQQLADERKRLEDKRDMAEAERQEVEDEIKRREDELNSAQHEHDELAKKMLNLQSRLVVGGVDLLEKAKEQERLLEESARELAERQQQQERLQRQLEEKAAERIDIEGQYASLQEEAAGKTRKIKKVWSMLQATKRELEDLRTEYQRQTECSLENIRELTRDIKLQTLAIDNYIPAEYQELIESHCVWNEEIGEWQLRGIAYTGNHMRKQPSPPVEKPSDFAQIEMANVYFSYGGAVAERKSKMAVSNTRSRSARPRTAKGTRSGRPASSKQKRATAPDTPGYNSSEAFPTKRGLMTAQKHFA